MHLVDQEAPGLSQALRSLTPAAQRVVIARACSFAADDIPDLEPGVRGLLRSVAANGELTALESDVAARLAEDCDERYLDLVDQGAPSAGWLALFHQARLLTAISNAFPALSPPRPLDAIYELLHSAADPAPLIAFIRTEVELAGRS